MNSSNYKADRETRAAAAASMITCPKSVSIKSVDGDPRSHEHEMLLYNLDFANFLLDVDSRPCGSCVREGWEVAQILLLI
ncbi:hypothetical protein BGX24_000375 [Mortierella sp. AD032]|nr:hypothetical protein BGX24_000375 [Mortierella sp. AD032]